MPDGAKRYIDLAERAGLTVERVKRGRHLKLLCRASDGRKATFIAPITPSDHRALQNKLSQMRRFERGLAPDDDPENRNAAGLRHGANGEEE